LFPADERSVLPGVLLRRSRAYSNQRAGTGIRCSSGRDITATSGSIGIKHLCVRFRLLISEPIVADDYKGVGPFIMAALELGR